MSKIKRKGFSLTFRLSLGFTLLITLLMGAVGFSTYVRDSKAYTQEAVNRGWAIVQTANAFTADALNDENNSSLEKMVRNIRKNGHVISAAVIDNSGKVVASDGLKDKRISKNVAPLSEIMNTKKDKMLPLTDEQGGVTAVSFISPVLNNNGSICGYLYIILDFSYIRVYLEQMTTNIIFNFVLASIAGLLLARLIIIRAVGRPVKVLQEATEKVAVGDFSFKLPVTTGDELGRLARSFNTMSDQLGLLFNSIKSIVRDMSYTSTIITNRSEFLGADETSDIDTSRRSELMKEINSGVKRLARMSDQLNSLAMQFKTES